MSGKAKNGSLLLYGVHPVEGVLRHRSRHVSQLIIDATLSEGVRERVVTLAESAGIEVSIVDRNWFDGQLAGLPHQKLAVWYQTPPPQDFGHFLKKLQAADRDQMLLLLDGIQDPQNFGACVRVAEALGAAAVIYPRDNSAPLSGATHKAAAGAAAILPLIPVVNLSRALEQIKAAGFWVYGTAGDATTALGDVDFANLSAIVMGAEGRGMRSKTRTYCDQLFRIPMNGQTESLNVSVASGIALYAASARLSLAARN